MGKSLIQCLTIFMSPTYNFFLKKKVVNSTSFFLKGIDVETFMNI